MIDWDDAFDNSGYVPAAKALLAQWAVAASEMRKKLLAEGRARLDVSYGSGAREEFDLFTPNDSPKGTVIFVHGGYWHMLDKSYWSHFAKGCLDLGWSVAIPSYPLAPQARISQITTAIQTAVTQIADVTDGAIVLVGHSAGGHLVTRMATEGVLPATVTQRIAQIVAVSGVYHLDPLLMTQMNATLGLTSTEVKTESPVSLEPVIDIPTTFWVGDHERPEFLRQTRMVAEIWAKKKANVQTVFEQGKNHFTVLESLQDRAGVLTRVLTDKV